MGSGVRPLQHTLNSCTPQQAHARPPRISAEAHPGAHNPTRLRSFDYSAPRSHQGEVAAAPQAKAPPNSPASGRPVCLRSGLWPNPQPTRWPTQSPQRRQRPLLPSSPPSSRGRQSRKRRQLQPPSSPPLLQPLRQPRRPRLSQPLPPSQALPQQLQPLHPRLARRHQSRACQFVPTWSRRVSMRRGLTGRWGCGGRPVGTMRAWQAPAAAPIMQLGTSAAAGRTAHRSHSTFSCASF